MPVDVLTLPSSSINTKWKEPYASASLNAKLVGVIAPGIYRGLRMVPDPSLGDRTIVVQADADKNDHVAVYESDTGYSVTYRDSISGDITLSLVAYASVSVVVCVFITYTVGVATSGSYRTYTEAEFNALSAAVRDHLVILGTVAVPASGAIPSGNISLLRRTLASSNFASGTILNAPLVKNADFEVGETNATHARSSLFWDKSMTVGTGTWKTDAVTVDSGMKSIELNVTAGPVTGELSQQIGVQTVVGQLFLVSVRVQQRKLLVSIPSSFVFFMEWSDVNDALLSTTTQTLNGVVDLVNFRTVETIIPAPAGAASLRAIGVRATALDPLSTGVFAYIDGVNVDVEPVDAQHPYPFDQAFRRSLTGTSLALYNKSGTFADAIALARFDPSTPSGEGRVLIEPGNPASLPPTLELLGRFRKLGSGLLGTEANALKPRIEADTSVFAGVEFTLMWESARAGETIGTYTQGAMRRYGVSAGGYLDTVNARWDGTNWNKDVAAQLAQKFVMAASQTAIYSRAAGAGTWTDAGWSANPLVIDNSTGLVSVNANLTVDPPAATTTPMLSLVADTAEVVSMVKITGARGIGTQFNVNPLGFAGQPYRNQRYDSNYYDTTNTMSFWTSESLSNGGTVAMSTGATESHLEFKSNGLANSTAGARTSNTRFPLFAGSGFNVKFRIPTDLTSRVDWWGFTDIGINFTSAGNKGFIIARDTAVGTDLILHYMDSANANYTLNLGFSPAVNTWYYMSLIPVSLNPGQILFRIGTTPDWASGDTVVYNGALSGTGIIKEDSFSGGDYSWKLTVGHRGIAAVAKELHLSWIELFSTKNSL